MSASHTFVRLACLAVTVVSLGCGRKPAEHIEWMTMGTVASFLCRDADGLGRAAEVMAAFKNVETLLDAHDPNSELSRLAAFPEEEILARCDERVRPCYEMAFRLMRESDGAFNPRWRGPATLDLGGIAKGFALDLAAERIVGQDAMIDLGGNLKACGGEWKVGVYGEADSTIRLEPLQACATSAEYARGKHIYDGRTGLAVTNNVYSVTVAHPDSAMLADGLSTILFIFGREKGDEFLRKYHPEAQAIWQLR